MAAYGLNASLHHEENGMPEKDMRATLRVAEKLDEVIIFRSTGPWSRRWIDKGYPTKNFHVKGKSSDWGPQAGFVPYLGIYSKVGHDAGKAAAGTKKNNEGMAEQFADKVQLTLTLSELHTQLNEPEEIPPRRALYAMLKIGTTRDYFLLARRSGDGLIFVFKAQYDPVFNNYKIFVYPETYRGSLAAMANAPSIPLEVMTSSEGAANLKPMTGDYDLMAVCPTWANYMSKSTAEISKPGLAFITKGTQAGQTFAAGSNMDKVLDMRVNTGAVSRGGKTFQGFSVNSHNHVMKGDKDLGKIGEHGDMGNLTPRILRCINELNSEMNPKDPFTSFRRVHHNAESHRHQMFGALVNKEMEAGDGFPMTGFHPSRLLRGGPIAQYGDVATLENMGEFRAYANALHAAGYFVPKNWTWGMSIRDTVRAWPQR